jgi:hypothetical protein
VTAALSVSNRSTYTPWKGQAVGAGMEVQLTGTDGLGGKRNRANAADRAFAIALVAAAFSPATALADEGGVSFWLPGIFGSLAAVPTTPGSGISGFYYHTSVSASGNVAAARQVTVNRFSPTVAVNLNVDLDARVDLMALVPSYVFQSPVLGGQLAISMMGIYGRNRASIDGTLTASLGPLTTTRTGSIGESVTGVGDLYPQFSLKWNRGVHNYMAYGTGNIPVGTYSPTSIANIGLGHGAIDGGFGYTYFDPAKGHEFSVVSGLTYNFRNSATDYRSGVDWHTDWGASQFLSKTFFVGAVGYFYNQITDDSGGATFLNGFKSRVAGVGPQVGFIMPVGNMQGFLGLKSYFEFDARNRPDGWNAWVTFALSPAAAHEAPAPPPRRPMVYK